MFWKYCLLDFEQCFSSVQTIVKRLKENDSIVQIYLVLVNKFRATPGADLTDVGATLAKL